MELKYGTNRIVLLLPSLGVAIKFPRIRMAKAVSGLWWLRRIWNRPHFGKHFVNNWRYEFIPFLFSGVYCNRSEYKFWKENRNEFAWPTIISFWGLANIQMIGQRLKMDREVFWSKLIDVIDRDVFKDGHCFEQIENFCEDAVGRIYLLDYSSEGSQSVFE